MIQKYAPVESLSRDKGKLAQAHQSSSAVLSRRLGARTTIHDREESRRLGRRDLWPSLLIGINN